MEARWNNLVSIWLKFVFTSLDLIMAVVVVTQGTTEYVQALQRAPVFIFKARIALKSLCTNTAQYYGGGRGK